MRFKKLYIKKPTFEDILFLIFYAFVFLMPFLKFSIPAFGGMELTISDFCMLFLAFISIVFLKKINPSFKSYIFSFLLFCFLILLSFVHAKESFIFIRDFFPNIFAFLIITTTLVFFSLGNNVKRLNTIRNVLVLSLLVGGLPAYFEAISGIRYGIFYDAYNWRYTFLSQNPNQYGVASILYIFLIVIIDLMFKRANLKKDIFIILFSLVPMLYSGSRTAILSFSLVSLVVFFYLFLGMNIVSKMLIAPIVIVLVFFSVIKTIDFMKEKGGQINRALTIFEKIEKGENIAKIEGGTGASINEAIRLFKMYPILGVGIGNKIAYSTTRTEIHNTYLKFLAETGIVGFFGFLVIFFRPIISIFKSRTAFFNKVISLGFFLIFVGMNYPHFLFRQRWVWFFMTVLFVIGRVAQEEFEKKRILQKQ